MISEAKIQAEKIEDEEKKKNLWMIIAMWLLERSEENIKEVIQLTKDTTCIKIEDLLPYFN